MIALLTLIAFYALVLLLGKCTQKSTILGYIFVAILTILQVMLVFAYLYNMEIPEA